MHNKQQRSQAYLKAVFKIFKTIEGQELLELLQWRVNESIPLPSQIPKNYEHICSFENGKRALIQELIEIVEGIGAQNSGRNTNS